MQRIGGARRRAVKRRRRRIRIPERSGGWIQRRRKEMGSTLTSARCHRSGTRKAARETGGMAARRERRSRRQRG